MVCVARAVLDVSETGASVAASWDRSIGCFGIAVWLLVTKHTD